MRLCSKEQIRALHGTELWAPRQEDLEELQEVQRRLEAGERQYEDVREEGVPDIEASVGMDNEEAVRAEAAVFNPWDERPFDAVLDTFDTDVDTEDEALPEARDPVTVSLPPAPPPNPLPVEDLRPEPPRVGEPSRAALENSEEPVPLALPASPEALTDAPPLFEFTARDRVKRQLSDPDAPETVKSPRRAYITLKTLCRSASSKLPREH